MVNSEPVLFLIFTEYYLMDFSGFLNAFGGLIGKICARELCYHYFTSVSQECKKTIGQQ